MGKLTQRLSDARRAGVYRAAGADEIEDAARGTRLDVVHVDLRGAADKAALLERLARSLAFPDWFGGNWDALEDCLCDLGWRAGDGHVLLVQGGADLPADELGVLRDVLGAAADYWRERGRPFFAVFIDPQHVVAVPELFRPRAA
ncbi:MAG: barstar family protein [Burkholderiales bacterium]